MNKIQEAFEKYLKQNEETVCNPDLFAKRYAEALNKTGNHTVAMMFLESEDGFKAGYKAKEAEICVWTPADPDAGFQWTDYDTTCGHDSDLIDDADFCPYCGGRIHEIND